MQGFLLDSHVAAAVAPAVRRLSPDCEIIHLRDWRNGSYIDADDERILLAADEEGLVLVTLDLRTIPPLIARWVTEGQSSAGVAVITHGGIASNDIGGLSRSIVALFDHPEEIDPAYPVVYLRAWE